MTLPERAAHARICAGRGTTADAMLLAEMAKRRGFIFAAMFWLTGEWRKWL